MSTRLFAVHSQVIRSALIESKDCRMVVQPDREAATISVLTKTIWNDMALKS